MKTNSDAASTNARRKALPDRCMAATPLKTTETRIWRPPSNEATAEPLDFSTATIFPWSSRSNQYP